MFFWPKGASALTKGPKGNTPLHMAAKQEKVVIVEKILYALPNYAEEINTKNDQGQTPLHLASAHGYPDVIDLLLDWYADIKARDEQGRTPFHAAAAAENTGAMNMLLSWDTDILEAKDDLGNTPMNVAAQLGKRKSVDLLLAKGANKNANNTAGDVPLSLSTKNNHPDVVHSLLLSCAHINTAVMSLLLEPCSPTYNDSGSKIEEATFAEFTNQKSTENCTTSSAGRLTGVLPQGLGYVVRGATYASAALSDFSLVPGTLLLVQYLASYWSGSYRGNTQRNPIQAHHNNQSPIDRYATAVEQALQVGEKKGWG